MGFVIFGIWAAIVAVAFVSTAQRTNTSQTKAKIRVASINRTKVARKNKETGTAWEDPKSPSKFGTEVMTVLFEDREHDWLARQLKEEAKIVRRGDFLDLGANHDANCDAREIKKLHLMQHDDSIDNGEL